MAHHASGIYLAKQYRQPRQMLIVCVQC